MLAEEFSLAIKDHRFEPAELQVPAGQAFTLNVTNQDASPEEFESDDLDIEKVIAGGQNAVIKVEPLDAGRYEFYGEYTKTAPRAPLWRNKPMLGALVIVFREVIEAGLVVGIVLAATRGIPGRGWWVSLGILLGVLGASIVAMFAGAISTPLPAPAKSCSMPPC